MHVKIYILIVDQNRHEINELVFLRPCINIKGSEFLLKVVLKFLFNPVGVGIFRYVFKSGKVRVAV
jgi:hypothetical protein